jgi:hypothetical protein
MSAHITTPAVESVSNLYNTCPQPSAVFPKPKLYQSNHKFHDILLLTRVIVTHYLHPEMVLSAEAIIALFGIVIALPGAAFVI